MIDHTPDWLPLCTHGDTEQEVAAAIVAHSAAGINELAGELAAEGFSERLIAAAVSKVAAIVRQRAEQMAPGIVQSMAASAGHVPRAPMVH